MLKAADWSMSLDKVFHTIIFGEPNAYQNANPDISYLNTFSVSRLSWNYKDIIAEKTSKRKFVFNSAIFAGHILGKYTQSCFTTDGIQKLHDLGFIGDWQASQLMSLIDDGWELEKRIEISIPFKWKSIPQKNIKLVGHIDLLNQQTKEMIELKSSVNSDKIYDYAMKQVAVYWSSFFLLDQTDYKVAVSKIHANHTYHILTAEEKENYALEMINLAKKTAREIDKVRLNVKS